MRSRLAFLMLVVSIASTAFVQASPRTTFSYDENGNLTSKTIDGVVWTYIYGSRDLLIEVLRDGILVESYRYNFLGHRVKKAGPEGVVRYVWDEDRLLLITDDFGNTIAKYNYAGARLLSMEHATEGTAYFLFDGLGSAVALSKPDGSLAARFGLDAWGNLRTEAGQSSNLFLFTGYQLDQATGLYYAKARYYDPELGRFLTEDPEPGGTFEPQSFHPYLYAYGNPTVYLDPDGRCVGSLQQTELCHAIASGLAFVIAGNPEAQAEREIEIREKVVQGRREFREQMGREARPDEVVWSAEGRALTSGFEVIDTTGRIEPDHAELTVVGAGIGTRMAVNAARSAGATTAEQMIAAATQLGDEAVGQIAGVSPGDVAAVGRLAKRGLSPRPPPGPSGGSHAVIVGEAADRPGVDLLPASGQPSVDASGLAPTVAEGQIASAYPQGRRIAGAREGRRATDPSPGLRESGAFDWTPENITRMERGQPAIGIDGRPVELHHRSQDPSGPLDEMSATSHQGVEHPNRPSQIDRDRFAGERRRYWVERVRDAHGQGQTQLPPQSPPPDGNP